MEPVSPDWQVDSLPLSHLQNPLKEVGSMVAQTVYNVGDSGSICGSGRSPGEGKGNPLHYSCLENPMDRGTWQATVHEVAKESDKI